MTSNGVIASDRDRLFQPSRRRFLQDAIGNVAALALASSPAVAADAPPKSAASRQRADGFLTDVNVHVGQWPFRRIADNDPASMVTLLQRCGVKHAWAGSFDGLLHRDIGSVNLRLWEICRASPAGLLIPFGAINPTLPEWEEDIRRCHENFKMPGIRVYPSYHGYKLSDPRFVQLAELAARRGLVVQLTLGLEDRRTVHPMLAVPPVDLSPLPEIAANFPALKFVVLNSSVLTALSTRLAGAGRIYFDTSHQEGLQGLSLALQSVPLDRLLFGSHAPLFVYLANLFKFRESPLSDDQMRAIAFSNAAQILNQLP